MLTHERLREILEYNPETGIFRWKKPKYGRRKNKIAGCKNHNGYIMITHKGKKYQAHRLAFLYMGGYMPENIVDHIDRDPSNNKWDNLREVSHQCNMRNRTHNFNSTSGITGVVWRNYAWVAQIVVNREYKYLGIYKNFDDAVMARWRAELKFEYPDCNTYSESYLYLKDKNLI